MKPSPQNYPQKIVRDPYSVIPHVRTYSGMWNVVNRTYSIYFDEALRDSQSNTLAMRRDFFIHNLLRHRQLPVVCLPYSVVVEDPDHPDQKSIGAVAEAIIRATPHLRTMKLYLLEALFYGRFGAQIQIGPQRVRGNTWNGVVRHIPINGDKFRFRWDGTPGIAIFSGSYRGDDPREQTAFLEQYAEFIEATMLGNALFLETPFLRDRFIIHEFENSDTDYLFEIDESESVHGLGLRSRAYWHWNIRTEVLSWLCDGLQRVGVNGMLYGFFQQGNPQLQEATLTALKELVDKNVAVFPISGSMADAKDLIQKIDPAQVGYDVMIQLLDRLEDCMRQGFLGQNLSSESKPTGMGASTAELHADVRADFMEVDAAMLDETLTQDMLKVILKYNQFVYEGKPMYGIDLPFDMRIESRIDRQGADAALQNAQTLYNMGVDLDEDDLLDKSGLAAPKKPNRAVVNHMLKMQEHQASAQGDVANIMQSVGGRMTGLTGAPNDKPRAEANQMLAAPAHAGMPNTAPRPEGAPHRFGREPEEVAALSGKLYLSSSGWGLLKVPNDLVRGLFAAIDLPDVALPPQDSDADRFRLNAHISVLRPEEIEEAGGVDAIKGWNQSFRYQLGPIKSVEPEDWDGMRRVYFVDVESPELEELRERHGLTRLPNDNKYRFHITCAVEPTEWDERYGDREPTNQRGPAFAGPPGHTAGAAGPVHTPSAPTRLSNSEYVNTYRSIISGARS